MEHTPSPWEVVEITQHPTSERELVTFIQTPKLCFDVCHVKGILTREEVEANAKLIAAAPDLLEALQNVLDYEKRCAAKGEPKIGNGIIDIIHSAIEKATK